MQLGVARLCLDCEEVHDARRCPVCASDHYAFIKQWVPVDERHVRPQRPSRIFRPTKTQTFVFGGGVISLVTYWLLRPRARIEEKALRNAGELR